MPLLDHFAPPLATTRRWEAFHNGWSENLAARLNEVLPPGYVAEPNVRYGPRIEVDIAAFDRDVTDPVAPRRALATAVAYAAPEPTASLPAVFPDEFETLVSRTGGDAGLVAAVELVSPSNKDRPASRRAFVAKCVSYVAQGMGLVIVDVVSSPQARLHDEVLETLAASGTAPAGARLPSETRVWATAYRPVRGAGSDTTEVWIAPLRVGGPLPTLPLWIGSGLVVPADLETSYRDTCVRHRIDVDRLAGPSRS